MLGPLPRRVEEEQGVSVIFWWRLNGEAEWEGEISAWIWLAKEARDSEREVRVARENGRGLWWTFPWMVVRTRVRTLLIWRADWQRRAKGASLLAGEEEEREEREMGWLRARERSPSSYILVTDQWMPKRNFRGRRG